MAVIKVKYRFHKKIPEGEPRWNRTRWLDAHPEDIPMDEENMAARRRGYDDEGLRSLMAAIGIRAVVDYSKAYNNIVVEHNGKLENNKDIIEDCRAFFEDEFMQFFTNGMSSKEIEEIIKKTPAIKFRSIATLLERQRDLANNTTTIIEEQCDEQCS